MASYDASLNAGKETFAKAQLFDRLLFNVTARGASKSKSKSIFMNVIHQACSPVSSTTLPFLQHPCASATARMLGTKLRLTTYEASPVLHESISGLLQPVKNKSKRAITAHTEGVLMQLMMFYTRETSTSRDTFSGKLKQTSLILTRSLTDIISIFHACFKEIEHVTNSVLQKLQKSSIYKIRTKLGVQLMTLQNFCCPTCRTFDKLVDYTFRYTKAAHPAEWPFERIARQRKNQQQPSTSSFATFVSKCCVYALYYMYVYMFVYVCHSYMLCLILTFRLFTHTHLHLQACNSMSLMS